ncbi:DUF397 domain-containing protein [Dactylosporangium sp. NPDC051541]|uniref:DUF397 domain-containing protein n=1 Tax=Dactylosporangium sp. NPDC051541 TaxID=3363977 RepID=UPI00379E1216
MAHGSGEGVWRSAPKCGDGNCIEVLVSAGHVFVRDSVDPDGNALRFEAGAWAGFVDLLKRRSLGE